MEKIPPYISMAALEAYLIIDSIFTIPEGTVSITFFLNVKTKASMAKMFIMCPHHFIRFQSSMMLIERIKSLAGQFE